LNLLSEFREIWPKAVKRMRLIAVESVIRRKLTLPPELKYAGDIDRALACINQRWPESVDPSADSECPVFVFSAGWRSGSTLLQRILCSSGELVLWGEPLGDVALIPRLAGSLSVINDKWPRDRILNPGFDLSAFSESWIATISPQISYLKSGHRALLDEWLARPAREVHNVQRWGMKEVRLTIHHARYLRWLYPNARFVFIYRNLFDAYRSWRGNTWGSVWPGYFSWSPVAYARHWKYLLGGFLEGYQELGGYLIRFEDLTAGRVNLEELAAYVGISGIDPGVLDKRIGSPVTDVKRRRKKWITPIERGLLRLTAGDMLRRVGY